MKEHLWIILILLLGGCHATFLESCAALAPNSVYDRGICFVFSPEEVPYNDAQCPNKNGTGKGHLAFVTGQRILNLLNNWIYGQLGEPKVHIGLKQFDTSDEPDGGWYWWDNEGNQWDATYAPMWVSGEPDNAQGAFGGCLLTDNSHVPGLHDCYPLPLPVLCQYSDRNAQFKSSGHIKAASGSHTMFSESTQLNANKCGELCAHTALCRSFSYAGSIQQCQLHSVDVEDLNGDNDQDYLVFGRV